MSMLKVHVPVPVLAAHHRCVGVCEFVFVCMFVFMCINAGMPDCPETNDAKTGQVMDQGKAVRHFFGPVPD
jgi:hypothetical protein